MVHLSAAILTNAQTPPFNGSIEVNVAAEDLPSNDTRQNAQLGKQYLLIHCASIRNICAVIDFHQSVSNRLLHC